MDGPAVLPPCQQRKLAGGTEDKEHAMSQKLDTSIAVIGIDIGKNSFHIVVRISAVPSCCGRSGRVARWGPKDETKITKNLWKEGESKYKWNRAGTLKDYSYNCEECGKEQHFMPV